MASYANYHYHHKGQGGGVHSTEFYKAAAERYYKDTMDNAASYNTSIRTERKFRLPFLDSQTRVAQNHSNLWIPVRYRSKGTYSGQIYNYPAKRWRKKKRPFPAFDLNVSRNADVETGEADVHQISTVENPAAKTEFQSEFPKLEQALTDSPQVAPAAKYEYYDDWENGSEPPDAGEIDDRNSDSSDFEETYVKKKKKKPTKKTTGRGRKSTAKDEKVDDTEKPYACELCGARYKTRPGLSYHLSHFHHKMEEDEEEVGVAASPKVSSQSSNGKKKGNGRNTYCDFCLGDEDNNKKTGGKEELVSCADCGRSGHPTCLQFTENMLVSVKKYPWQCIECKSCGLCGTSDNDDQLLFCDDCDRGYHMYCLNPPLQAPPEGSWSCHLCIAEFYNGKAPPGQAWNPGVPIVPPPAEQQMPQQLLPPPPQPQEQHMLQPPDCVL